MIDWQATGIYIAYPTTDTLKRTYPGHRSFVNNKHTKLGMAKHSFQARAADYEKTFQGEVEFVPLAVVSRSHLTQIEAIILAEMGRRYKTVGYTKEWFHTDDRPAVAMLVSQLAVQHSQLVVDLSHFHALHPSVHQVMSQMSRKEARQIIESLASARNPISKAEMPMDSVLRDDLVQRALEVALSALKAMSNAGTSWSKEEDQQMLKAFDAGESIASLSRSHDRTEGAIRSRLVKLGRILA